MQRLRTDTPDASIAESIGAFPVLTRLGAAPLPDPAVVARFLETLREVSYPGYHGPSAACATVDTQAFVADRVPALAAMAQQLVLASMGGAKGARAADAQRIAGEFIERIPAVRALLAADVEAAYRGDPSARSREEIVLCYPGLYALTVHRYAHELLKLDVPLLPRMMTEMVHAATGIDLPPGAEIGAGVFIDHGTGVVIGETCVIGEGCKIYQGVTLGVLRFERNPDGTPVKGVRRHPTLERNVTIYANATVLGGETIVGEGSTVASGVCLTRSVPPGHLVAGPRADIRVLPQPEAS
ncbi:MAG: serine acetyltransferase [Phycisphaerae bacterium]|nr:serine acetyltransferase [Phycisphaerae bacterium]